MGQRPSQCRVCGCFQFCLYPGATGCAEAEELAEIEAASEAAEGR